MHSSETVIWKEKEKIRDVQMDNLRGLLGIRRMDKVSNSRIRVYVGECGASHSVGRDELLTFTRCHSFELPQLYETLEG